MSSISSALAALSHTKFHASEFSPQIKISFLLAEFSKLSKFIPQKSFHFDTDAGDGTRIAAGKGEIASTPLHKKKGAQNRSEQEWGPYQLKSATF